MLQDVVKNANQWCREHMTVERLNLDFLSVFNGYVKSMDMYENASWGQESLQVFNSYVGKQGFKKGHGGFVSSVHPNLRRRTRPERKSLDGGETWDLSKCTTASQRV